MQLSESESAAYRVYDQTTRQVLRNVFTELCGTAAAYWLSPRFHVIAQVLYWIFVAFSIVDLFQIATMALSDASSLKLARSEGVDLEFSRWLTASYVVRLVANIASWGLLYILLRRIW
jgi:hypothetical protein